MQTLRVGYKTNVGSKKAPAWISLSTEIILDPADEEANLQAMHDFGARINTSLVAMSAGMVESMNSDDGV